MVEKKIKEEKKYPITVSDWIVHLNNKTSTNKNLLIFFGTMIIVIILGVIGTYQSKNYPSYLTIFVVVLIYVVFIIADRSLRKRVIEPYNNLLERIIRGEITEPKEILEEYKKIPELK